jgi:hypothetical protein
MRSTSAIIDSYPRPHESVWSYSFGLRFMHFSRVFLKSRNLQELKATIATLSGRKKIATRPTAANCGFGIVFHSKNLSKGKPK